MKTTRREFLAGAAAAAGSALLNGCAGGPRTGGTYSVALLGDVHYDSTDTKRYHRNYTHSTTAARYKLHLAEHVRNAAMWKERLPSLIKASAAMAAGAPDTAFALQLGDLVQGDCGDANIHREMLDDAFSLVKGAYGGKLPLVTVVGNHDVRGDVPGDGALETFDAWQPAAMSRELSKPVRETTFSFRRGPDVFIVVDFNAPRPAMDTVRRLFRESEDARHTFVVTHGPAIPSGASRWFLLGAQERDADRRELLSMMARRRAVVLAGHTHKLEFHRCVLPGGSVSQLVANSVWAAPADDALRVLDEGAAAYGARCEAFARKQAKKGGKLPAGLKELVAEYKPLVADYFYANAAGHYRLNVSDRGVTADFFPGASSKPARTFILKGPDI